MLYSETYCVYQAYDYTSVMHNDSLAFSKNGFETMIAKRPEMTKVIGSAIDFSPVRKDYGRTQFTINSRRTSSRSI